MTLSAFAHELSDRLPSEQESGAANQLRTIIAAQAAGDAKLRLLDGDKKPTEITLTPALSGLLMDLLRHIGSGDAVTLVPVRQMLTTQQATDILNVSRPFLVSLLERGDMPFTLVGRHRRVQAEDLFAYKRARDTKRSTALASLAEADADLL